MTDTPTPDCEERLAALWASADDDEGCDHDRAAFIEAMDVLCAELPGDSAIGSYERGGPWDSTGREREAVSVPVGQLTTHMMRYRRSMSTYARELVEPGPED
jgi:hypothetical protein